MDEACTERVVLSMPSTSRSVDRLEEAAVASAQAAGFDAEAVQDIALAVREAAANAVLHGNGADPARLVTASLSQGATGMRIVLRDQGRGFRPEEVADPHAAENLMRGSGRGLLLMRSMMDEVEFRQGTEGMEVAMVKRRPPTAG